MTIAITTPEGINMWVLLSRRAQLKLQSKGLKTAGLIKWCKANIEGCENARTWRDCVVPVEYAIAERNGPQDFTLINVHVMMSSSGSIFVDMGVFPDMASVEANPEFVSAYNDGALEIVYTLEDVRPAIPGRYYEPA